MGPSVDNEIERHVVEVGLATWQDVETTKKWLENAGQPITTETVLDEMAQSGVISEQQAGLVKEKVKGSRRGKTDAPARGADQVAAEDGTDGGGSGRQVQAVCSRCGHRVMVNADDPLTECPQTDCTGRLKYMEQTIRRDPEDAAVMKGIQGRLGFYQLQKMVGYGGFSLVYAATIQDDKTGKSYPRAIKLLHQHLVMQQREVDDFFDEVAALQQVTHPSMVRVYESGTTPDGRPFIVMDFVQGQDLRQIMEARADRMDVATSLGIVVHVANALREAHKAGLIHRDIKPGNIMVRYEDDPTKVEAVLLDFGIAKLVDGMTSGRLTYSGTKAYQAPEQMEGHPDRPSDIYAMGVLLYQLLADRLPHQRPSGKPTSRRRGGDQGRHKVYPLQRLGNIAPRVQTQLERLTRRCLDLNMDKRPTAEELASELVRIRAQVLATDGEDERTRPKPWGRIAAAAAVLLCLGGATLCVPQVRKLIWPGGDGIIDVGPPTVDPVGVNIAELSQSVDDLLKLDKASEAHKSVDEFETDYEQKKLLLERHRESLSSIRDKISMSIVGQVSKMADGEDLLGRFGEVIKLMSLLPPKPLELIKTPIEVGLNRGISDRLSACQFDEASDLLSNMQSGDSLKVLEDAGLLPTVAQRAKEVSDGKDEFLSAANEWLSPKATTWTEARDGLIRTYAELRQKAAFREAELIEKDFRQRFPNWSIKRDDTVTEKEYEVAKAGVERALREASSEDRLRQAVQKWADFVGKYSGSRDARAVAVSALDTCMTGHFAEIDKGLAGLLPSGGATGSEGVRSRLDRAGVDLEIFKGKEANSEELAVAVKVNAAKLAVKEDELLDRFIGFAAKAQDFAGGWKVWNEFFQHHSASSAIERAKEAADSSFKTAMAEHETRTNSGVGQVRNGDPAGVKAAEESIDRAMADLGCVDLPAHSSVKRGLGREFVQKVEEWYAKFEPGGTARKNVGQVVIDMATSAAGTNDRSRKSSARSLLQRFLSGGDWPSVDLSKAREILPTIEVPPIEDEINRLVEQDQWAAAFRKVDEALPGDVNRLKNDVRKRLLKRLGSLLDACDFDKAQDIARDVDGVKAEHEMASGELRRIAARVDEFVSLAREQVKDADLQWPEAGGAVSTFYKERLEKGAFETAEEVARAFQQKFPSWDVFSPSVASKRKIFVDTYVLAVTKARDAAKMTRLALERAGTWQEARGVWEEAKTKSAALLVNYEENSGAQSLADGCVKGAEIALLCESVETAIAKALALPPKDLAKTLDADIKPKVQQGRAGLAALQKAMTGVSEFGSTADLSTLDRHIGERDPSRFAVAVLSADDATAKEDFGAVTRIWEEYLSGGSIWVRYRETASEYLAAAKTIAKVLAAIKGDQYSDAFKLLGDLSGNVRKQQESRVVGGLKRRVTELVTRCELDEADGILDPIRSRVSRSAPELLGLARDAKDKFVELAQKCGVDAKWPEVKTELVSHYEATIKGGAFEEAERLLSTTEKGFPGWQGLSEERIKTERSRFDEARKAVVKEMGSAVAGLEAAASATAGAGWEEAVNGWRTLDKEVAEGLGAYSKNDTAQRLANVCPCGTRVAEACSALGDVLERTLKSDRGQWGTLLSTELKGKLDECSKAREALAVAVAEVDEPEFEGALAALSQYLRDRDPKEFLNALAKAEGVRGDDAKEIAVWDGYLEAYGGSRYGSVAQALRQEVKHRERIRTMRAQIREQAGACRFVDAFRTVDALVGLSPDVAAVAAEEERIVSDELTKRVDELLKNREWGEVEQLAKGLKPLREEIAKRLTDQAFVAQAVDSIRKKVLRRQFHIAFGELDSLRAKLAPEDAQGLEQDVKKALDDRTGELLAQRLFDDVAQEAKNLESVRAELAKELAERATEGKQEFCRLAKELVPGGKAEWPQCRGEVLGFADRLVQRGDFDTADRIFKAFPDWSVLGPTRDRCKARREEFDAAYREAHGQIAKLRGGKGFDAEKWDQAEQACQKLVDDYEESQQARELLDDCSFGRYETKAGPASDVAVEGWAARWKAWREFLERYPKSSRRAEAAKRQKEALGRGKKALSDLVESTGQEANRLLIAKKYKEADSSLKHGAARAKTLDAVFDGELALDERVFEQLRKTIAAAVELDEILAQPSSSARNSRLVAFLGKDPGLVEKVKNVVRTEADRAVEPHCRRFEADIARGDAVTREAFEAAVEHLDRARDALKAYARDFESIPALKRVLEDLEGRSIDPLEARMSPKLTIRSEPSEAEVFVLAGDGKKIRIGRTPLDGYDYVVKGGKYRICVQKRGWCSPAAFDLLVEDDKPSHEFRLVKPTPPPGFDRFWTVPDGDVDQFGNPVVERDGSRFDPATGWPYEIWFEYVGTTGFGWTKRPVRIKMEFVLVPGRLPSGERHRISDLMFELRKGYVLPKGKGATTAIVVRKEPLKLIPVSLGRAIYLGKYEVTRDQFAVYDTWEGKELRSREGQHPAYPVPWMDAAKFCEKLTSATKMEFRLPTDMEWECACRAGSVTQYPWGDDLSPGRGNFLVGDETGEMSPVGRFPANRFGLYDMIGGVSEWCSDDSRFGARITHAIARGGWFMRVSPATPYTVASHYRVAQKKSERYGLAGFRVCVTAR